MSLPIVIEGGTVLTQNAGRQILQADVLVDGGRIAAVGHALARDLGGVRVIDARGRWVLPGLIQGHVHLTQTLFRGLADDRELLPWLRERIWPLEAAHTPETNYVSAELGIAELLASGTTTILDMGTTRHHGEIFEAARELGIRYVGGKAMMDQGEGAPARLLETTKASLAESDRLRDKWHGAAGGRLSYAYAPRFILSCSNALLSGVAARSATDGCLIHTHASENQGEIAAVRAITGLPNLAALARAGCLTARTVVAHGVWVEGDEEETLVASGAAVCHCPGSNLKLASGVARVPALRSRGVRIALGSDGAACNNTLDAFFELRLAGLLHRLAGGPTTLSAQAVFDLASIEGARALGLERELGSVEPGKRADLVIVEPSLAMLPCEDPVAALVFGASGANVRDVLVDGVRVVRDGEVEGVDPGDLARRAARARAEVARAAGVPLGRG